MSADRCTACAGSGEDFNEGDPCHVCHGRGVTAAPAAPAAEPVVATVTECEACFTPDVCQLRGTCDHYAAEKLRVKAAPGAAPAQSREPLTLTDEQIAGIAEIAIGYDGNGFQEVHSGDLCHFAQSVIAEFCKINGIGSQQ